MSQAHSKFAVFASGPGLEPMAALALLSSQAHARSVDDPKFAAKSLGVEYLERSRQLVLTIGYTEDPSYPIRIHAENLGPFFTPGATVYPDAISKAMEKAAAAEVDDVLCHEFFATDNGSLIFVMLVSK